MCGRSTTSAGRPRPRRAGARDRASSSPSGSTRRSCPATGCPEMIERGGRRGPPRRARRAVAPDDLGRRLGRRSRAARHRALRLRRRGGRPARRPPRPRPIAPNARVVVVDGDAYYSRPGPRLADGVRQLGHLLHPDAVPDPRLDAIELLRGLLSPGGNTVRHGRTTDFTTRRTRLARRARDRRVHSRLRRRLEGDDRRRSGPSHDRRGNHDGRRAELRPHARADRGPVLPRPRSRPRATSPRIATGAPLALRVHGRRRDELRAAQGRRGRRLALRRRGRLLRRRGRRGDVPARHPDDRRVRRSPSSRRSIPAGTWAAPSTCT